MSLLEASNFKVTARLSIPSVSVLYKPTRRRYTYTAIADRMERSRRGVLASGCCVDRGGTEFSVYDDSEIQRHARKQGSDGTGQCGQGGGKNDPAKMFQQILQQLTQGGGQGQG